MVGTTLYAIGGKDQDGTTVYGTLETLDTLSQKWKRGLPDMPTKRKGECVVYGAVRAEWDK